MNVMDYFFALLTNVSYSQVCIALIVVIVFKWLFRLAPKSSSPRKISLKWKSHENVDPDRLLKKSAALRSPGDTYLVIGAGQVGGRIIEALVARGEKHVRALDVGRPKCKLPSVVKFFPGDICNPADLELAFENVDVVYLTAALIRYYERMDFQVKASYNVNVRGTQNVVNACLKSGVKILVQTSSSNTVVRKSCGDLTFSEDTAYVDESSSPNVYGWTKAEAEKIILKSDGLACRGGVQTLRTVSVRPCSGIFSHNDGFILERFMREGKIDFIFPEPIIDWIYVDNVVWCHMLAESRVRKDIAAVTAVASDDAAVATRAALACGRVFCASNEDPLSIEDLHSMLASVHPEPLRFNYLPRNLMYALAHVVEWIQWISMGKAIKSELKMLTPAMTAIARLSYVLRSKRARLILGYTPLYTVEEGVVLTSEKWLDNARSAA
eukprot:g1998.t1